MGGFDRFRARLRGSGRSRQAGPPLRSLFSVRTVAGQVFLLLLVFVVLLVTAAVVSHVLQGRRESTQEASLRTRAVAEAFAHSPAIVPALDSENPTATLQPWAEEARRGGGVDLIVVYSPDGIRYTHRYPDLIGEHVVGSGEPPSEPVTQTTDTTSGVSVISLSPVRRPDGSVAGTVAAGITVERVQGVVGRQLPVLLGSAGVAMALATGGAVLVSRRLRRQTRGLDPAELARLYEHHDAVLHAVREGVLIIGSDGRLLLANDEARRLLDLPADAEGRRVSDVGLDPATARLLTSRRAATDEVCVAGDRLLAVNLRHTGEHGGPPGIVATLRDTTDLRALAGKVEGVRERLLLLYEAGARIGTTLDVTKTAEELTEVAIPRFADFATVDLVESVLRGEEPITPRGAVTNMRRTAVAGLSTDHPFHPVGYVLGFIPDGPSAPGMRSGRTVLEPDVTTSPDFRRRDPERTQRIIAYGVHSLLSVPLHARGVVLGMANFWRTRNPEPFHEDDVSFAEELVARAAVCVDNARRYTREHEMAVTLQRSLLPSTVPEQNAVDVAFRYLPAQAGVGGDWFDVIPLPGSRVALVVGDVVGHGLHAAATMGRLRTAVQNFSTLDRPADELLARVDELVGRMDQEERAGAGETEVTGATCLYAIYDPVTGRCSVARAGHMGPAVVLPDGTVEFPETPAGLPLGLGGLPFEAAEVRLPEGSRLVLFTDGLVEARSRDLDAGLELLRASLSRRGRTPEETCADVLRTMLPTPPGDDVALLVAGTRILDPDRVASWDVAPDPSAVAEVRKEVTRRLGEWGLEAEAFATELILSELVTNAIRYGAAPIRVRLLYDRTLICEVSDTSSTAPHLRYAATTDEGGRGLFLVAQFAERWGTRYTDNGKVIWSEQTPGAGVL
ncbi:SpoIIE family protein phosphatase/ATP-binding protein [Streptomyces sp. ISL-100]|uniref:SpoIIE family protein phosphatase/ATP-binding protein n=1 Tax=Streptomyces sp. ISL-100 TaxID=2819173 RepID=UPI001BEB69B1|nr:SpoIIE family protein phosphatase/ATP-binding protein [Streptomyces sp. ISL-100]MBT2400483.1 SpoIIE family protein phosphatase [Streptomyces sp. ISL-100]